MNIDWSHCHLSGNLERLSTYIHQKYLIDHKSYMIRETIEPKTNDIHSKLICKELYYIQYGDSTIKTQGRGLNTQTAAENGALVALRAIEYIDGVLHANRMRERDNGSDSWEDLMSVLCSADIDERKSNATAAGRSNEHLLRNVCVQKTVPAIETSTPLAHVTCSIEPVDFTVQTVLSECNL